MTTTDTKLTEDERQLLELYRLLDAKRQGQVLKTCEALRVASKPSKYAI